MSTAPGATRIFKARSFARFASTNEIADEDLVEAVKRAENGLIDADLGAGLIKQRLARAGQGKSGSFRAVTFFAGVAGQFLSMVSPRKTGRT